MMNYRARFIIILITLGFTLQSNTIFAAERGNGLYATFVTNMGNIVCKLYEEDAPETVENFVGLAKGTKEFLNSKTKEWGKTPFYNGLIFHRVIPGFMIQGGCPLGTGTGGPGYKFKDEFSRNLRHDKPGKLSMANSGPDTNGSQFFITVAPTPWLDNRHSIFGQVVEGMDVVCKIADAQKNSRDKPLEDIVIQNVEIEKIGE